MKPTELNEGQLDVLRAMHLFGGLAFRDSQKAIRAINFHVLANRGLIHIEFVSLGEAVLTRTGQSFCDQLWGNAALQEAKVKAEIAARAGVPRKVKAIKP